MISIILIVAVLYGIYHEDKLIEWEDRLIERLKR